MGIRSLFADLPSNLDQTRSMHNNTASRMSLRRRQSVKPQSNNITGSPRNEVAPLDAMDLEDGDKDIVKSIAAPMSQRKSFRFVMFFNHSKRQHK